jgi:small subunit ribosomal protein S20
MPIIKSAKKRVRTAEKAAIRNSKTKRTLKVAIKAFRASFKADDQSKAQSAIDTAAKKGLIHKNKAARQKAQLARNAKSAGTADPAKKAAPKKTAAKPATAKKTAAAKPAVKKAPAKKPAAKK